MLKKGEQIRYEMFKGSSRVNKVYKGAQLIYESGIWTEATSDANLLLLTDCIERKLKEFTITGTSDQTPDYAVKQVTGETLTITDVDSNKGSDLTKLDITGTTVQTMPSYNVRSVSGSSVRVDDVTDGVIKNFKQYGESFQEAPYGVQKYSGEAVRVDNVYSPAQEIKGITQYGQSSQNALYEVLKSSGKAIRIDNVYSPTQDIKGIVQYGESIQNGVPTPEAPIAIEHSSVLVESGEHAGEYATSARVQEKNLFDGVSVCYGKLSSSRPYVSNYDRITSPYNVPARYDGAAFVCQCEPNQSYVPSGTITGSEYGGWYIGAYENIDDITNPNNCVLATLNTITTPNNAHILVFMKWCDIGAIETWDKIQLELGSTATAYTPYVEPVTATIYTTEPLRGGDVWDIIGGTVTRNRETHVFDGTEALIDTSLQVDGYFTFGYRLYNDSVGGGVYLQLSSHFPIVLMGNFGTNTGAALGGSGYRSLYFRVPNSLATSRAAARTWFAAQDTAGTPVTIEYQRITPLTIPVTAFEHIPAISPVTTIISDGVTDVEVAVTSGGNVTLPTPNWPIPIQHISKLVESGEHVGLYSTTARVQGKNLFNLPERMVSSSAMFSNTVVFPGAILELMNYDQSRATIETTVSTVRVTSRVNGYGAMFPLKVNAGETYTLSFDCDKVSSGTYAAYGFYNSSGTRVGFPSTLSIKSGTINVPSGVEWLCVCLRLPSSDGTATYSNIQIELGDTATVYETYIEPITRTAYTTESLWGIPVTSGGNVTINGQQYIADMVTGTQLVRRVAHISSYNDEEITAPYISSTGELSTGAEVYYALATTTTETVTVSPASLMANTPITTWISDAYSDFEIAVTGEGNVTLPTPNWSVPIQHKSKLVESGEHTGLYATSSRVQGKNLASNNISDYSVGTYRYIEIPVDCTLSITNIDYDNSLPSVSVGFTGNGENASGGVYWALQTYSASGGGSINLHRPRISNSSNGYRFLSLYVPTTLGDDAWNRLFEMFDIQLELGSTATAYEPYIEPVEYTIYTAEPLRQDDVWDVNNGIVTRNSGTHIFDGTEGITFYDGGLGFAYTISDMKNGNVMNGACTHVVAKTSGSTTIPGTYCFFGANNSRVYFRGIISISDDTMESQRTWLTDQYAAGTPVTVEYELATPIVIPVTAFESIPTNVPTTTIISDGNATFELPVTGEGNVTIPNPIWQVPIDNTGDTITCNQLIDKSTYLQTKSEWGITFTNNGDGSITVNGTATGNANFVLMTDVTFLEGHKYLFAGIEDTADDVQFYLSGDEGYPNNAACNGIFTIPNEWVISEVLLKVCNNSVMENTVYRPQLFDLTAIFGDGKEPATVAEFRRTFPNDYYEYGVGIVKYAEPIKTVNDETSPTQTATKTIYLDEPLRQGDTVEVVDGRLIRNRAVIQSYNGEAVGDTWISTTGELSTGATVEYELETPIITDIATQDITPFEGTTIVSVDVEIPPSNMIAEYYTTGASDIQLPTPKYPVEIKHMSVLVTEGEHAGEYATVIKAQGKNLVDLLDVYYNSYTIDINLTTAQRAQFNSLAGKTVTVSFDFTTTGSGEFGNIIRLYSGSINKKSVQNGGTIDVFPDNITSVYCYFYYGNTDGSMKNIQFELGDTATPYEPYHEPVTRTIYTTEPIRQGDVVEVDVEGNVTITRNTAAKVFDGTETPGGSYALSNAVNRYFTIDRYLSLYSVSVRSKCTHMGFDDSPWTTDTDTNSYGVSGNTLLHLHFGNSVLGLTGGETNEQKTAALMSYLAAQYAAGTPVTVEYQLAEPIIETTTIEPIPTFEGTTFITVDSDVQPTNIEATYYKKA